MRRPCILRSVLFSVAARAATLGSAQQPFDLDTSFRTDLVHQNVNSLVLMDDGGVVISGQLKFPWEPSWLPPRSGAKLLPNGARDTFFEEYPLMGGKLQRWNGKLYAANGQGLRRLNEDGSLDATFSMVSIPYFSIGQGGDYHVYPDGRVLFSGSHILTDSIRGFMGSHELVWFFNNGYLDTTATHRSGNGPIYEIEQQPDGKFLCSGWLTQYDGQPCSHIFRVHPDGALDTTFHTDFTWGEANAFTTLPDGRILASGSLKRTGLSDTLQMVRLMPDGSLDNTFNNALSSPNEDFGELTSLGHTRLDDGRIVLHGNFYSVDGEPRRGIALLSENGFLLNDYFNGAGCGNYYDSWLQVNYHYTRGMVQDPSGNWYIYGTYIGYDDGTTNDPQQRFVSRLYGLNVGVREVEEPVQLEVYPNPAHTSTTVRWARPGSTQLRLLDVTGREVYRSAHQGTEAVLDLGGLPAGPYVIQITDQTHRRWSRTLIVEP